MATPKLIYLELCISHIPDTDSALLENSDKDEHVNSLLSGAESDMGYFIPVPSEKCLAEMTQRVENSELSDAILNIWEYAQTQGASLVCLDRDNDEVEDLETYNW